MSTGADASILNAYGDYADKLSKTIDYATPAKVVAQGWGDLGGAGMETAVVFQKKIEAERRAEEDRLFAERQRRFQEHQAIGH